MRERILEKSVESKKEGDCCVFLRKKKMHRDWHVGGGVKKCTL